MQTTPLTLLRLAAAVGGATATAALAPAVASAGTIGYEGDALVLRAAPGEANSLTLGSVEAGRVSISDSGGVHAYPAGRCARLDLDYPIHCDLPARIRVELGDADDRAVVDHMVPAGTRVEVLGGDGRDELKLIAGQTAATLEGGAGDDRLRSEEGADTLVGGPGADELLGHGGADVLRGGDGDDLLRGDAPGFADGDVLDGGAGTDTVDDWAPDGPGRRSPPVSVTFDGVANDGRPGEGDDVGAVERLDVYGAGTFVLGDGDESLGLHAPPDMGPSTVSALGGDDVVTAGSGNETIDGGAGADRIDAGFGHDTITGGPGRDAISADSARAQCGGSGQSCTIPFGNDVVHARDGEADTISCGAGEDRAVVDAIDVVAADCEVVDGRGPGAGVGAGTGAPVAGGGGERPATRRPRAALAVIGAPRLRAALRTGLRVRVTGLPAGRTVIRARVAGRIVGSVRVRVRAAGTATARLRFTAAARRALARRRSVRITLVAGPARVTAHLRR